MEVFAYHDLPAKLQRQLIDKVALMYAENDYDNYIRPYHKYGKSKHDSYLVEQKKKYKPGGDCYEATIAYIESHNEDGGWYAVINDNDGTIRVYPNHFGEEDDDLLPHQRFLDRSMTEYWEMK